MGMGPIMPPGAGQQPPPQEEPGPGIGGGSPAAPGQANPQMEQSLMAIKEIVSNARRLGMMYPAAVSEVRSINNLAQRLLQKIQSSGPAPEPMSPPV